jgi:hypothetical protein
MAATGAGDVPMGWVEPAEVSTRSGSRWRRIPIGWVVTFGVVVGVTSLGAYFAAGRSDTGEIVRAGSLYAADLLVGDCFDLKDPESDEVGDVTAVPCDTEHEFETFHVGSLPAGDFPGTEAFHAFVDDQCLPAFATYVGRSYGESALEVYSLVPTEATWADGDRTIQCTVYHPRIHRLTESLKGSAR